MKQRVSQLGVQIMSPALNCRLLGKYYLLCYLRQLGASQLVASTNSLPVAMIWSKDIDKHPPLFGTAQQWTADLLQLQDSRQT